MGDTRPSEAVIGAGQGPWPAGTTFAGHVIEAVLGRGGMGVVYRAYDPRLDRRVALKVIAPALAAQPGFAERFLRESRAIASVEHENVVAVYAASEQDGVPYLVTRLIDGTDLAAELAERGRLEPEEAVEVVAAVAAALDAAHARGVVHRDVKPSNVLVSRGPPRRVALTDFGIAVRGSDDRAAEDEGWAGTVAYVAPEQVRGQPADGRADVYALGGVLHHCLAGSEPYPRADDLAVLSAHLFDVPPQPSRAAPGIPAAFDAVVRRAMAKTAAQRYATAGELADAARRALAASGRPAARVRLPPSATLFGRDAELRRLEALAGGESRLLTLTGPGGSGKTQLAVQLARRLAPRFADGAVFADLSALRARELVVPAIIRALDLVEDPGPDPVAQLAGWLAPRTVLLVLDNLEQIPGVAEPIARLLGDAPRLVVVSTSRRPLGVEPERAVAVESLSVPPADAIESVAGLRAFGATAMLLHRVERARGGATPGEDEAPALAMVARRLDGLPLAIELAAARLRVQSAQALLPRLRDRLAGLGRAAPGAPARQETMRGAIEWSHALLEPAERHLFARLAVFDGGFVHEAAAAVAELEPGEAADLLEALVDHALVVGRGGRLSMLELVRDFAAEQLNASGEEDRVRERHARAMLRRFEEGTHALTSPRWDRERDALELERDNLRAAIAWARAAARPALETDLLWAAYRFWFTAGGAPEARSLLRDALARIQEPALRGRLLVGAAAFATETGDDDEAGRLAAEALALGEALDPESETLALFNVAASASFSDPGRAEALIARAADLTHRHGLTVRRCEALGNAGYVAVRRGDLALGRSRLAEAAALERSTGYMHAFLMTQHNIGAMELGAGHLDAARAAYGECLKLALKGRDPINAGAALAGLAEIALEQEEPERAVRLASSAQAVLADSSTRLQSDEHERLEATLARARSVLPAARYEQLRSEGSVMAHGDLHDSTLD